MYNNHTRHPPPHQMYAPPVSHHKPIKICIDIKPDLISKFFQLTDELQGRKFQFNRLWTAILYETSLGYSLKSNNRI